MKNLLFLCGPNGIGKSTISREIVKQLPNSAYVDSDACRLMNPFSAETIPTIAKNISDLILNYMSCPVIDTVIFSYGFHGRRIEVFEGLMKRLEKIDYNFVPFLLWCSEEENIKRMQADNRSLQHIERAFDESRKSFTDVSYPRIDISCQSVSEAAKTIVTRTGLQR